MLNLMDLTNEALENEKQSRGNLLPLDYNIEVSSGKEKGTLNCSIVHHGQYSTH